MGVKIRTDIDIAADIETVWKIVADLSSWGEWNKWMKFEGLGEKVESETSGKLLISPHANGKWTSYDTFVNTVDHERHFVNWSGAVARGCLFRGNHWITLTKTGENQTHMINHDDFTGLLPAMRLGLNYPIIRRNYHLTNKAIKEMAEKA